MSRMERLLAEMKQRDLDALYLVDPANITYLTGFTGDESTLLVSPENVVLLTDGRFIEQAKTELADEVTIHRWQHGLTEDAVALINASSAKQVGFEAGLMDYLTGQAFVTGVQAATTPVSGLVEELRAVKDASEIAKITEAAKIVDATFYHMLDVIRPGMTERAVAAELDFTMAKFGSTKPSFGTIVASGLRSTFAHGEASDKVIEAGDMVTLDFGATYQGYVSDTTRTIAVGTPDPRMEEFYAYVVAAEKAGLATIRDGVTSAQLDAAIRQVFLDHDVNQYLIHGLGHSIGLLVHEAPYITPRGDKTIFRANMVQTIEPGLYLPGVGGMRVEDDIVVQAGQGIQITSSPKSELIKLPVR